ncbi:MAG: thiosulfate oxidation carrier protein SoxY [Pararhodobacter sp.]
MTLNTLSRRNLLAIGAAGAGLALLPLPASAASDALVARFTNGAPTIEGPLRLDAPALAENGNSVSITLSCPDAEAIRLFAPANPNPEVCTFHFGPLAGSQSATTRIRMAETMDLIAVARMPDGRFIETRARVEVTLGGCVG